MARTRQSGPHTPHFLTSDNQDLSEVSSAADSQALALPDRSRLDSDNALVRRLGPAGRDYAAAARAKNTVRAYRFAWADFTDWCQDQEVRSLPANADDVARYIGELAQRGLKTATIQLRLASIAQAHKAADQEPPTRAAAVRMVWAGIKRTHGTAQDGKSPLLLEDLRAANARLQRSRSSKRGPRLRLWRDRAILLVGFATACRRSELVGLEVADVVLSRAGATITLRRSKTDQEGAGRKIGVPWGSSPELCPLKALQAWQDAAGITTGPLFRAVDRHGNVGDRALSSDAVALIVKARVAQIGLDPARYAGHSLRAGLATSAAAADVSERTIAQQTGHKSMDILRRYIRDADLFRHNAAGALGL